VVWLHVTFTGIIHEAYSEKIVVFSAS